MALTTRQPSLNILAAPDPTALALSLRASCLVFEDDKSKALLELIHRIAPSEATALIIGETGTGKELIARHLHELGARRAGPFVAVNCAAITETLMESELFGHERGAFTGAVMAKTGSFETADGGSLFLDEIGDLPLALQAKLLRVIQEREVVRVGSRQPIAIDVRLIAATNVNLDEAVAAKRFREDLYYRLYIATVNLPPLRERPATFCRWSITSSESTGLAWGIQRPTSHRKPFGCCSAIPGPATFASWKIPCTMRCWSAPAISSVLKTCDCRLRTHEDPSREPSRPPSPDIAHSASTAVRQGFAPSPSVP